MVRFRIKFAPKYGMKKFILFFGILVPYFILNGCHRGLKADSDEVVISGKFSYSSGELVYLYILDPLDIKPVDSVALKKDGSFQFTLKTSETNFYLVKIQGRGFITLLMKPGEAAELYADATRLSGDYQVEGSPGSSLIAELNQNLNKVYQKIDTLGRKFKEIQGKPDFIVRKAELDSTYNKYFNEYKTYLKTFIDKNQESLATIIALYQNLGRRAILTMKEDMPVFEKVAQKLLKRYPDNVHVVALNKRIREIKKEAEDMRTAQTRTAVNSYAPEITLKDTAGRTLTLTSLQGKNVLLYFSSSGSIPGKVECADMIKLYRKYHYRGFEIFSVYVEKSKDEWVSSLRTDKIPWISVSDLKNWDSPVVKTYGIDRLPYMILINKEGKITAKDISVRELEYKLSIIYPKQEPI